MTVYLFHVVEEKTQKSLSFCKRGRRNLQRGKSFRIRSFDKNRADVLAASDRGSQVEQEKLIVLDEEEQSRWENEIVSSSHRKLKIMAKTNLQNRTHKSHCNSWPVKQFLPNSSENFLTNLVARVAEFRSCKEYFPPGATFETAL